MHTNIFVFLRHIENQLFRNYGADSVMSCPTQSVIPLYKLQLLQQGHWLLLH